MRQAVALVHRDDIIARVAAGEYLASIANSLGLAGKGQAISNALASDPEYQAAKELGLEAKMALREAELEAAAREDVPRARELLSHARWRAEREAPARWGQRTHVQVEHVGDLADKLRRARERVIEHDPEQITHGSPKSLIDNSGMVPTEGTTNSQGSDK